jgi:hypothetical protein
MRCETGSILGVGNVEDEGKCAAGAKLAMEAGSFENEN